MSFRVSSNILRAASKRPIGQQSRPFHSPFAVLGNSPLTSPPPPEHQSNISSAYEKHYDHAPEPVAHTGYRTYVVSEPDAHSRHYQVPAGAYPTSAPYVNFTATSAPDVTGFQYSSTSGELRAHEVTSRAAAQHAKGVGESSAVRNASSPGAMGVRGGGYGGLAMMDKKGTTTTGSQLADRNPPPDGAAAEKYSKAGVDGAWKLRK
ncbi:hypothetical protein CPB83DRAFT_844473 [Crepidotus variabilis]|uniref:Uncharacterized protein n=1 Tax=Crepidotus variabilis TaxID=179855 RepID=A0A9P6JVC5_9AGAR|nr:hypothetical protein CPB83DRAFT_844473 [Crepidotus variabilis]